MKQNENVEYIKLISPFRGSEKTYFKENFILFDRDSQNWAC